MVRRSIVKMDDAEFARFMKYVDVGAQCWLWTGVRDKHGYGKFWLRSYKFTHRLMLERTLGRALGEGMCALHSCRNTNCCNPEHLREGTPMENQRQRVLDGTDNRGEQHGNSKLTEEQVRAIRIDTRTQRVIAEEYGVGQSLISDVKTRKKWSHVV